MGKAEEQKESPQEKAFAAVARAKLADFRQRWAPLQRELGRQIQAAGQEGSFERRRAAGAASTDSAVAFAGARQRLNDAAADRGVTGSSAHKLGMTGMAADQAMSSGATAVALDQAGDDALVQGLGTMARLGQGKEATAIDGLSRSAQIGASQAALDAELSLADKMGEARLAGQVIGTGAGMLSGSSATGGIPATNDLPNVNGANAMDQFMRLGTSGD